MLPILTSKPVHFNLTNGNQRKRISSTNISLLNQSLSTSQLTNNDRTELSHKQIEKDHLTLYPITVEFDRLLRRQQQLKQYEPIHSPLIIGGTRDRDHNRQSSSKLNSTNRTLSSSSSTARSTPTNGRRIHCTNGIDINCYDELNGFMTNLDAHELLYSTMVHYYASLYPANGSNGNGAATFLNETEDSTKKHHHFSHHQSLDPKVAIQTEVDALDQIYRTLCTPGTRTIVLLADKNDIVNDFMQNNPSDIASQLINDLLMEDGGGTNFVQSGTNHDDADGETSDLETDYVNTRAKTAKDRHQEFCASSGINSSMSEDCLSSSIDCTVSIDKKQTTSNQKSHSRSETKPIPNNRGSRICKLMNFGQTSTTIMNQNRILSTKLYETGKCRPCTTIPIQSHRQRKTTKRYHQEFDHFLEQALKRQQEFYHLFCRNHLQNSKIVQDQEEPEQVDYDIISQNLSDHLGLEQQIIGCVTFYKSYRLTGIKVIEIALISVASHYQSSGIGTYLLKSVKESGQIGPYDVIRVKIPSMELCLKQFFMKNDFTDDLILNASFDQLDSVCSEGEDEGEMENDYEHNNMETNLGDQVDCEGQSMSHSISFDTSQPYSHLRMRRMGKRPIGTTSSTTTSSSSSSMTTMTSMCYLPPFSVATALSHHRTMGQSASVISSTLNNVPNVLTTTSTSSTYRNYYASSQSRTLLQELDARYVDEMIDEANGVWRRDLLAAYRTQWSCVGRLRAEIIRMRDTLRECESTIDSLKRENHQLKTKLLQNETTAQLNAQKHLFLLQNFNFDSLDF